MLHQRYPLGIFHCLAILSEAECVQQEWPVNVESTPELHRNIFRGSELIFENNDERKMIDYG